LHRAAGEDRVRAIQMALVEITAPLVGSTLTPIVVFLPLVSMTGVYGTFFRALAVTMGAALLTSLGLALTWTPTLSLYLLKSKGPSTAIVEEDEADDAEVDGKRETLKMVEAEEASMKGFFLHVINFYERWLRRALQHPWRLLMGAGALVLISVGGFFFLGSDLLPEMDEGGFILDYLTPAGSSLAETDRVVSHLEKMLKETPEVESTSRRTGLQLGLAAVTEANRGDISVKLKAKRSRSAQEVISELRARIMREEPEPAVEVEFPALLQDMINDLTGAPEPVVIKLFSEDPKLLEETAPRVADVIKEIDSASLFSKERRHPVADVKDGIENTLSGPGVEFRVNPTIAARAGFTAEEVSTDASALLQGVTSATPLIAGNRAYTIRVRFPESSRASLQAMRDTVLTSSTGKSGTLGALAQVEQLPGQTEIIRENLLRVVQVTARFDGESLGSGMAKVRAKIDAMHLPAGVRVVYGGLYAQQQTQFRDMATVMVMAILLVFLVLLFEFRSFSAPVAILSSALLSISGVVLALVVTGTTVNLASLMGMIMVIGIVAKNGILLLDAHHKFTAAGFAPEEAMIQAGRRRLRPIFMTALATVAGMLPLAFAWGAGSQMLQPLAIGVIGGVMVSMVLSLVVTPTVFFYASARAKSGENHEGVVALHP
ncbi:MAG TPA: efflux RND transporter permease subunit, partial [Candidatus Saccharimonadales bacterium]|nr:efflux RND transporter permease subunit [Candidatus Saccharimonadales bacterium]